MVMDTVWGEFYTSDAWKKKQIPTTTNFESHKSILDKIQCKMQYCRKNTKIYTESFIVI